MIGPEGAAAQAAAWLTARLPVQLRRIEDRLGLPAGELADPAKVLDHEDGPIGLEDWPAVYVLPQRLDRMSILEVLPDGSEVHRCAYLIRVLAWVRADDYASTDALRKRYVLAIREALLERKGLTPTYDPANTQGAVVDPGSIREDYGPVIVDEAKRTIAGAYLDVTLVTAEVTAAPAARGTVNTVAVTAANLDPGGVDLTGHPAL